VEQIGIGNNFLNRTQKAQQLRETMNKWDCIELKSFCTAKETQKALSKGQGSSPRETFNRWSEEGNGTRTFVEERGI
jgi:hypothetical protein